MKTADDFMAWLHRQNKPETKALERWKYGNPADFVQFGKKREVQVDRPSNQEIADTLLIEWYRWDKAWRPHLGAPRISPSCSGYLKEERHAEEEDAYAETHRREMRAVAFCVGSIAVPMQQAIGAEMKNREVRRKVWRSPGNVEFSAALNAVLSHMRKHRDLMALFN